MEPNIVFGVTAVVVVLAAVIFTYKFGPRRRNEFVLDLFKAIGEPVRPTNAGRRRSPHGRSEVKSSRDSSTGATGRTVVGDLRGAS